jgi:hypothetical protein
MQHMGRICARSRPDDRFRLAVLYAAYWLFLIGCLPALLRGGTNGAMVNFADEHG